MRSDERIIEYDIANVQQVGSKIPVVLTNRAVYFLANPAVRTPYAHILDLQARGPIVAFATKSGNAFVVEILGPPKGDIYDTISHHLDELIRHREDVLVPGGYVLAICRSVAEDAPPVWLYMSNDEIGLDTPEVKHAISVALSPAAERLGVPLPP